MNNAINDSEKTGETIAWRAERRSTRSEHRHNVMAHEVRAVPSATDDSARRSPLPAGILRRILFEKVNWPISSFLLSASSDKQYRGNYALNN
jgi:hypothetical protein